MLAFPGGGFSTRLSEAQGIRRDVLISSRISLVLQMPLVPALLCLHPRPSRSPVCPGLRGLGSQDSFET